MAQKRGVSFASSQSWDQKAWIYPLSSNKLRYQIMTVEQHPNGFSVKLLHTFSNGARIRLHRWYPGRTDNNDPHDHRTWFISIPLWGIFREHRYQEVAGSIPIFRCRHEVSQKRLSVYQDGTGDTQLISSHWRIPFIPYFCSADEIHTVAPRKSGFAASLVLFGPPCKDSPKVWCKKITTQKIK